MRKRIEQFQLFQYWLSPNLPTGELAEHPAMKNKADNPTADQL